MSDQASREALRGVLKDHSFIAQHDAYGMEACSCGWRRDGFDAITHEEHQADMLLASGVLAEVRP